MSTPLDKISNRFKELQGKSFVKIPQELIRLEERLELINAELRQTSAEGATPATVQLLESRKISTLRAIQDLKKNLGKP